MLNPAANRGVPREPFHTDASPVPTPESKGVPEPEHSLPAGLEPVLRPRRLRVSAPMRNLVAETRVSPAQLIVPAFVRDGIDAPVEIASMPGVYQHTVDSLVEFGRRAADAGVGGIIVFGVPNEADKDFTGSNAWDPQGIQCRAVAALAQAVGDRLVVMADTCLDETTDHGHCGPLRADGSVDNDWAVSCYAATAVAQARAGAAVVAPSGMMDGQVRVIRAALDAAGFTDVAIMAYSAKYASGLFGPFSGARRGLSGQWGILHDRGRRGAGLDRPRPRGAGVPPIHRPGRGGSDLDVLRPRGGRAPALANGDASNRATPRPRPGFPKPLSAPPKRQRNSTWKKGETCEATRNFSKLPRP